MSYFDSLSPEELIILANLVTLTFTEGHSSKDNIILGNFLSTVSSLILCFAAQQNIVASLKGSENQVEDTLNHINQPIDVLNHM